jgi:hypothetical protein
METSVECLLRAKHALATVADEKVHSAIPIFPGSELSLSEPKLFYSRLCAAQLLHGARRWLVE